jgi:hypothetical protein
MPVMPNGGETAERREEDQQSCMCARWPTRRGRSRLSTFRMTTKLVNQDDDALPDLAGEQLKIPAAEARA